jgi:hypothetical protein
MQRGTFTLVEECVGRGDLMQNGAVMSGVRYRISRYQGMLEGSGMPVPGLHRIEGSIDLESRGDESPHVGAVLTLRMEDGRTLAVTLADRSGRIVAEGHGPSGGCSCC